MIKLLQIEKAPLLLTLLFTFIGVQYNYLVEGVIKSPVIEYNFKITSDKNVAGKIIRDVTCVLTDISHNTSFSNLDLTVAFRSAQNADSVYNADIIPVHPSSFLHNEMHDATSNVFYKIGHLQPGMRYELTFSTMTTGGELPELYLDTTETVRLMPASLLTWLVKYSFYLNLGLLITFVGLSIIYLIKIPASA